MSMESLTHGEYYYFRSDPSYRKTILEWAKELGIKIRLPFLGESRGVTAVMVSENKLKRRAAGRTTGRIRRWKSWDRKKYPKVEGTHA